MALVLIGFMGAGKSSAARELAAAWGVSPLDSDTLVVERLGHSIAEEFERPGEDSFRAVEEEVVCGLLESAGERAVVSLGGGSVLSERVRDALRGHTTVLARRRSGELLGAGGGRARPRAAAPGHRQGCLLRAAPRSPGRL